MRFAWSQVGMRPLYPLYLALPSFVYIFLQAGNTALQLAAYNGFLDIVSTLLADPRVDVNLKDMVRRAAAVFVYLFGVHILLFFCLPGRQDCIGLCKRKC